MLRVNDLTCDRSRVSTVNCEETVPFEVEGSCADGGAHRSIVGVLV